MENNLNATSKGVVLSTEGSNKACSKGNKDQAWLLIYRKVDPFESYIRNAKLQEKLHLASNTKTPDGSMNPTDCYRVSRTIAQAQHWDIPTQRYVCKMLLCGPTRIWSNNTPLGFTSSYHQPRATFLQHFPGNKRIPKTRWDLSITSKEKTSR